MATLRQIIWTFLSSVTGVIASKSLPCEHKRVQFNTGLGLNNV